MNESMAVELPAKRRLLLIVHGKSANVPELREAVETLRSSRTTIDVRVTWEAGDAPRFVSEGLKNHYDVIVAGGGDGTLNEVVNGVISETKTPETAVAVLPLGTANDFATSCGLMRDNLLEALRVAAGGEVRSIDVGQMNDRYFLNLASGGFGAEITADTSEEMKRALGGAAYSVTAFLKALNFRPYHAKLTVDGEPLEETLLTMAVGNGRQCGGGYELTPRANVDDGLLDVLLARDFDFRNVGTIYHEISNPDFEGNEFVAYHQCKHFTIETAAPFQINLDGEPNRGNTFEFQILEGCLPFVMPSRSPLLRKNKNQSLA